MSELKLAVYGYGTNAGKAFFEGLADAGIECAQIFPLAFGAGEYDAVSIQDRNYGIVNPEIFDFEDASIFISFLSDNDSKKLVKEARESGCLVIDAGCEQPEAKHIFLDGYTELSLDQMMQDRYVVPMNSTATMLSLLLKPIAATFGLEHAEAVMLESVSGLGADGAGELARETIALLNMRPIEQRLFETQMAFNVHTAIGETGTDGITSHERDVAKQLELSLGKDIASHITLNCVVVPVFYGYTAVVSFTVGRDASLDEVRNLLGDCVCIEMPADEEVTPASHGNNENQLYVSRVHGCAGLGRSFSLTAVMDNARRGLAMNVLAIVKKYVAEY